MAFFSREKEAAGTIDMSRLPCHIAIIMDGNGRWATRRGLPRSAGHLAGAETFRRIAQYCRDLGIKHLTVYAFSTENWKRSEQEVSGIMSLLRKYLEEALEDMEKNHVRIHVMGDRSGFSKEINGLIRRAESASKQYGDDQINICLNYGGRAEIVGACRELAQMCCDGKLSPNEVDERLLASRLYSAGIPDPDLVIRPGGEKRISNFLLWQAAYSELYFTDTLWPDFKKNDIDGAILEYQRRTRRFGGA